MSAWASGESARNAGDGTAGQGPHWVCLEHGEGVLSDEVLLRICRVSEDDPQITPEWLSRLRCIPGLVGQRWGRPVQQLEAALALLAAVLGQLDQYRPTCGYSGPQIQPRGWIERETLERIGKQIVGLVWSDAAAPTVANAVEHAVTESVRLGFLEQREYDAWRPGMPSGSGWRCAVTATPYGVARALVMTEAPHGQCTPASEPRTAARPALEDDSETMDGPDSGTPGDIKDVRDALRLLGIPWQTDEYLTRLHALGERSIFAARQVIGAFMVADTPQALPSATVQRWLQHLLQTAVEIQVFPDRVPDGAADWDALAKIWDEYIAHSRDFHLSGLQRITESDPWSIRGAVKAAWNIEFASVGSPAEIGPIVADSAHRAALRLAPDLWLAFGKYTNEAADHQSNRPRLWDEFASRWCSETVQNQCERVRAWLAKELATMRDRLAGSVQPQTAGSVAQEDMQYRRRFF